MSPSPIKDRELRAGALKRLAIATRERPEAEMIAVYLADTAGMSTATFVEACARLGKSSAWFPKLAELIECGQSIAKEHAVRRDMNRLLRAPKPEPISPEKFQAFLAQVRAAISRRTMP